MKDVCAKHFPQSEGYVVVYYFLLRLHLLKFKTCSTVFYVFFNIHIDIRPINRYACEQFGFFYTHMICDLLLLDELSQYLLSPAHPHVFPEPPWLPAHLCLSTFCTMSCHTLDTALAHGSHHNTCKSIIDLPCLVHVLHCPLLNFLLCWIGMIQLCYLVWQPELSVPLFFSPILTHPHWSTCSSLFLVVNSLIISSSMHFLLSPWINCSFNCLSNSL